MAQRKVRTVSVPPELDARMDRVPNENWSAIACQSFANRAHQLDTMKIADKTERAVAKLRASRESATNRMYQAGECAGADYVLNDPDYLILERLEKRYGDKSNPHLRDYSLKALAQMLTNDYSVDEEQFEAREWIEQMTRSHGDNIDHPSWLEGFVKGALDKFSELHAKLDSLETRGT